MQKSQETALEKVSQDLESRATAITDQLSQTAGNLSDQLSKAQESSDVKLEDLKNQTEQALAAAVAAIEEQCAASYD